MADPYDILEKEMKKKPNSKYQIVYDSSSSTLEPIYFWVLNFMNNIFGGKVEKIVDNFVSSPGSGHFSELSQRKTIMQDNVSKTLGAINQVTKSIINLVYDLKDFEIRLVHYDDLKSNDKYKKEAAMLSLKQIWMDNVDVKRGRGSMNMMSQELNFITLRDAFMAANSLEEISKPVEKGGLDLNERVRRILKQRMAEFLEWTKISEMELRKRFNIEKNYLKSQVNTLQLYSKWVKPYLKAATELEMKGNSNSPELVTAFNTILFELTLMGKNKVNVKDAILDHSLPEGINPKREYTSCVIVKFHFRGIPQKAGQHYLFGGRATVDFRGYALNDEELKLFEKLNKDKDIEESMKLIEGATTESLDEIKKDIDHFLKDDKSEKEQKNKEKNKSDINPFSALFSGFSIKPKDWFMTKKEKKEINSIKDIKKDSYSEKITRELAGRTAGELCFVVYDIYKKAHRMASHDSPFE